MYLKTDDILGMSSEAIFLKVKFLEPKFLLSREKKTFLLFGDQLFKSENFAHFLIPNRYEDLFSFIFFATVIPFGRGRCPFIPPKYATACDQHFRSF